MPTIAEMMAYLATVHPNSEASALHILETEYPSAAPVERAEAARRHRDSNELGLVG